MINVSMIQHFLDQKTSDFSLKHTVQYAAMWLKSIPSAELLWWFFIDTIFFIAFVSALSDTSSTAYRPPPPHAHSSRYPWHPSIHAATLHSLTYARPPHRYSFEKVRVTWTKFLKIRPEVGLFYFQKERSFRFSNVLTYYFFLSSCKYDSLE